MYEKEIEQLQEMIDESNRIVFFGGAGVSTESNIPDFRSATGIYHQKYKYSPEQIVSHTFFMRNTEGFYEFYKEKMMFLDAKPNAAHKKLAELEQAGKLKAIGISNFLIEDIASLLETAKIKPMVNQILLHISNTPMELVEYCQKNNIAVEAYSPIAHGEILNQPEITTIAKKYGVTVPQLCIRYTIQFGAISLPKTGNPEHMKSNAELDFEISAEDMELLKNFKKIKSYGDSGIFPVYGGKM